MRGKIGRWAFGLGLLMVMGTAVSVRAQSRADPEAGGELYVAYCAVCHGIDGQGRIGASLD
ncbi:MAG: hypothetical protein MUO23_12700, partial [Anaerolineales bacterium]|nr:hypothetical protein [Anaerolineales bacterium]